MKTLSDIKSDMSALYDEVRDGACELKTASELANIAGKFLKAEQLELAKEVFLSGKAARPSNMLTDESEEGLLLAHDTH
jgi:hypothetical protein